MAPRLANGIRLGTLLKGGRSEGSCASEKRIREA